MKQSANSSQLSAQKPQPAAQQAEGCKLKAKSRRAERGSSLAWTAIFLATVVLPLMLLVIDGSRLFYVRGHLQTAVDAACEDAAWSGADYRAFGDTGAVQFAPTLAGVLAQARGTFENTLGDRTQVNFTASVSIVPDYANVAMRCSAAAVVPLTLALGTPVTIHSQAVSSIRFSRRSE